MNNSEERPSASVIIPTYNRKDSLLRTLDSLSQQTFPADDFEVIVVDDGGQDGTDKIQELTFPFRLRYVYQENQSEHVARNNGAKNATGHLLMLLDDDIIVSPEYISSHVQAHQKQDILIALGVLRLYPKEESSIFHKIYGDILNNKQTGFDSAHSASFVDCMSGVLTVKRDHFFEIGGMQLLPGGGRNRWGGVDFGYRAHLLGFKFLHCDQAIAWHDDFAQESLKIASKREETVSYVAPLLFYKHPGLQPHLLMFRDKTPISLKNDSGRLILRKMGRAFTAWKPILIMLEQVTSLVEQAKPEPRILRRLYDWVISSYIYRGYRRGLKAHQSLTNN